jgi:hypothetical protein
MEVLLSWERFLQPLDFKTGPFDDYADEGGTLSGLPDLGSLRAFAERRLGL